MGSLGVSRSRWPVRAWIRLRLPAPGPGLALVPGVAPPTIAPLDVLEPNPVPTDPRKRVFAHEAEFDGFVVRLVWDADQPELLEAEYRAPRAAEKLPPEAVRRFWQEVRHLTEPIGPLPVLGADPRP